ncbi:flagellar assembly protein FliW [Holophaga foetida]|uniref:flagellar assembly protein FliW n=1 Tax=Holophaga foetida TaxID=35839 RepID=UPI0002472128|nr:flagellar assembly protein FliW [Holophaga foetida]
MAQESILLSFPQGLAGFPELKAFNLFEPKGGYPLKFLQAAEHPEVSFVCMDIAAIKIDYEVPLCDEDANLLALERQEDALVLALVVVPANPRGMTANLAGPLVINAKTQVGLQVMLDANNYPLQYPVFGPKDEVVLQFPKGLIGFPDLKSFRLFEPAGGYPLKFLQAVDQEEISFTCIDAGAIKGDYNFPLDEESAAFLALERPQDALVLALVVIPEDPRKMTANLAGPLVINVNSRNGCQLVLNPEQFPLKYPFIQER